MKKLEVIIPISLELDWPTKESVVREILEQNRKWGFTHFALACPGGGWRSVGYPPKEYFTERAELFAEVKKELEPHGIVCGWWETATVKSGTSEEFSPMVRADGSYSDFANCPLDPEFRKRFAGDIATFSAIAKPAFIFTEDDFSIRAAGGCFCKHHLAEFSRRMGREYAREDVVKALNDKSPENIPFHRAWRELLKDSLVGLAEEMRKALDVDSPEIPMGSMQAGGSDYDGDCSEAIARAMAGKNHVPFSRLFGTFYGGVNVKEIPNALFHPLYSKQHIGENFKFYHESDTFPHTRFYTSGAEMRAIMGTAYSYGYDGSTFQTQQLLDFANEEPAYGKMFSQERDRFNAVYEIAPKCKVAGVEIGYDPFYNTFDDGKTTEPMWLKCLAHMGIPYTTQEADVAFWDEHQAKFADHETVMKYLSKGLFLDGDAAKALCDRGYGEYIGVEIGENAVKGKLGFDLGARDVLRDGFAPDSVGRNMPSAHMFSPGGNGMLYEMKVINSKCEIISEEYTFQKEAVNPTMARFENSLGGRIVVMAMALYRNNSQCLFNYRRQKLFAQLLEWCGADVTYVKNNALIYTIQNEAKEENEDFAGMITLINLSSDNLDEITLHVSEKFKNRKVYALDITGKWKEAVAEYNGVELTLKHYVNYLDPLYLLFK